MKKAILAFGGNALIKAGEDGLQKDQLENAKEAAEMTVRLLGAGIMPIIVHGNGPQIGNILIQQEEAANIVPPYTMDIAGAQTQGSMGYILQRCIENMLHLKKLDFHTVTMLTEVVVDPRDPGFKNPTKPVGPFYRAFRSRDLEREKDWTMKEDAGRGWRRLVPSPIPLEIVQLGAIRNLVENRYIDSIRDYNEKYLSIFSRDVLAKIRSGDSAWEGMVPEAVAGLIKERKLLGYREPSKKASNAVV